MDIAAIEEQRRHAGIQQKILCRKANVDASTYSQLKLGRRGAYAATLQKLKAALDDLVNEGKGHG